MIIIHKIIHFYLSHYHHKTIADKQRSQDQGPFLWGRYLAFRIKEHPFLNDNHRQAKQKQELLKGG